MKKKFIARVLVALVFSISLLVLGVLIRARFLPEIEIPILLYECVGKSAGNQSTVPLDTFYLQMRDLAQNNYETITPRQLRAYRIWGIPLPDYPFMITFDVPYRNLLSEVSPILKELSFTAVVNLPTTYIASRPDENRSLNGLPTLSWQEIQRAMEDDVFVFGGHTRNLVDLTNHVKPFNEIRASRHDIKKRTGIRSNIFSYPFGRYTPELRKAAHQAKIRVAFIYGDRIAKIGPKTDMLALPRIRVVGGRHAFSTQVVESRAENRFGFLNVTHPVGHSFPMSVLVYSAGDMKPLLKHEVEQFSGEDEIVLPLPSNVSFPLEVEILDQHRMVLYFVNLLPKDVVVRDYDQSGLPVRLDYPVTIDSIDLGITDEATR